MDHETPELIEAQMAETRQSLTEKVAALEDSVVGTVQSATAAVQDTVQTVRNAVEGTVDAVKENVASALDVRHHVRSKPWAMVGGATVAGVLAGAILFRKEPQSARAVPVAKAAPAVVSASAAPGVFDAVLGMIGAELKKLAETTIASASAAIHRVVNDGLPKLVDRIVEPPVKEAEVPATTFPIGRWNGTVEMARR